jgi:hypothetical protein
MALRTTVTTTDDLDGSEGARTIRFSWQDTSYEIDLSDENRHQFMRVLEPYITAGRKVSGTGPIPRTPR